MPFKDNQKSKAKRKRGKKYIYNETDNNKGNHNFKINPFCD